MSRLVLYDDEYELLLLSAAAAAAPMCIAAILGKNMKQTVP